MILPRIIRMRDAPTYLGMDRNRFNAEVRPGLTEIHLGKRGIGFDRLDLDAWVDQYVERNGRAPASKKGDSEWGANACQGSGLPETSGASAPLLQSVQKVCSDANEKWVRRVA